VVSGKMKELLIPFFPVDQHELYYFVEEYFALVVGLTVFPSVFAITVWTKEGEVLQHCCCSVDSEYRSRGSALILYWYYSDSIAK
jgi:hypothetical protein